MKLWRKRKGNGADKGGNGSDNGAHPPDTTCDDAVPTCAEQTKDVVGHIVEQALLLKSGLGSGRYKVKLNKVQK